MHILNAHWIVHMHGYQLYELLLVQIIIQVARIQLTLPSRKFNPMEISTSTVHGLYMYKEEMSF